MTAPGPPDWPFWRAKRYVKAYEAAALSLGINPYSVVIIDTYTSPRLAGWQPDYLGFASQEQHAAFQQRLVLAESWRSHSTAWRDDGGVLSLEVTHFARWAKYNHLEIPPEFAAWAADTSEAPDEETADAQDLTEAEAQSLSEGLSAACAVFRDMEKLN